MEVEGLAVLYVGVSLIEFFVGAVAIVRVVLRLGLSDFVFLFFVFYGYRFCVRVFSFYDSTLDWVV